MADRPRFGPAGVPPRFRILGAQLRDVPKLLREEGLDAFEYEAVQWGQKPQIQQQNAESLWAEAKKNDILLSMHGSYYLNLSGKKEVVEASKRRIIAGATAAQWMGAYVVVFHTGFYGRLEKTDALKTCIEALKDIVETMKALGIQNVKLGPETMGKVSQVGTLEEILSICEEVEQTQIVIDWAHLHARHQGKFRRIEDFRGVIEEVEKRLGTEITRNMHCHFSKIEFTDKGEKKHHVLAEPRHGPDFQMLAEVLLEFKIRPILICETPNLDVDALRMRDIFRNIKEKQSSLLR